MTNNIAKEMHSNGDSSFHNPVFGTTNSDSGGGGEAISETRREYFLTVSAGASVNQENRSFSEFLAMVEQGPSVYGGSVGEEAGDVTGDSTRGLFIHNDIGSYNHSFGDTDLFFQRLISKKEFHIADDMRRYVCPTIIVLGNITNLVAFLVLLRKKFKSSSVAFYMSVYAIANLIFLDLTVGTAWLCTILDFDHFSNRADWSCRLWTFATNVIMYTGVWSVVVMSIDRFIYLNLPSKASSYCTVFSAKAIVSFVIIGLVVVSVHAMWTYELIPQGCYVADRPDDLHVRTWPWWSATLYSYVPLLLLFIQIFAQGISICMNYVRNYPSGDQEDFIMPVYIITVTFFFLRVPSNVINLLDIHLPSHLLNVDVIAKIELATAITENLSNINNSLLGIILFLSSSVYRLELLCLFRPLFCCVRSRTIKVFEMRAMSNSDDSSPHIQVDYELCNNNDENLATNV